MSASVGGDVMIASLLAPGATLEKLASGCVWAEGPAWIAGDQSVRWSDIPNDRIMQFHPGTNTTSVYRAGVGFTNGRTTDATGAVVQCSHGARAIERDDGRTVTTIAAAWAGRRFNSPNDVVVHSDGSIWFTDPPYGIQVSGEGHPGEREYGDNFVFRIDPSDASVTVVIADIEEPNGLAFSPDESILYVSDTSAARASGGGGNRHIRAYDTIDGRTCKNGRTIASLHSGLPDGFRVDEHGRVWTSSDSGVQIFSQAGDHLATIAVPEVVSNLCFGGADGSDLYITATTSLYRIRTRTTDASALWRRK
ncbi:SMP-30/gluconolactonase/LRE family protein [Lacisediminihabitans sp. H27-G8]|uniref:SMP-30/gluconolactonase/LRE family protein n=1 Tax=Lacisediminihabitans sp. H27-G8 TaxID=3111909 RepID=UPI0038FC7F81